MEGTVVERLFGHVVPLASKDATLYAKLCVLYGKGYGLWVMGYGLGLALALGL